MDDISAALWACDIANWYQNPVLAKLTFPTRFVDLPEGFIERLLKSEGLFAHTGDNDDFGSWSDDDWSEEEPDKVEDDGDLAQRRGRQQETYPEFEASIKKVIDRWTVSPADGGVFPRLNWSSPLDAHWMGIGGSLRCTTVSEVLRFLEASDAVRSDLEMLEDLKKRSALDKHWKPQLALRKWHDFHTPNEFRCFVSNHRLLGISQKDVTNFWPFLVEAKQSHQQSIIQFFQQKLKNQFEISSYVFDVYIHSRGSVYLIDVSPFHEDYSEPILWSWDELLELSKSTADEIVPEIRLIETETNIMPNLRRMTTALPFDLLQPQQPDGQDADLQGVDPNNLEELVEKLKNITAAAERLNQASSS
jgi:hypothetical protein